MEQLKIDIVATTSKFDQQVRASGRMIQNFTDMIRRSGGSLTEVMEKFDTDATILVRGMGKMQISATDTRGAFKQLSTALQELKIMYGNLGKAERDSAFGQATQKSIAELQARLKGLRVDMQQLEAGNGSKSLTGSIFGGNLKAYFTARAIYGSIDLLKRGITDAVSTIAEFEQANANLAAVLGQTTEEISDLTENAKRLGATTVWTAGQITELQTTLARRGIGKEDILNMTEGISQLATATGINLAQAAEIAGSAMQAFGLQSMDMNDIAATLGVSTTKSALTMEKLHTSLAYVAPAAKAAGFNMRETVAMLGVLADSGLSATTSGVAVRNILIDLSRSSSKLSQAIGHPVSSLDELIVALDDLKERGGNNLEYISSLVEKRVVPGFTTLMNNTEKMAELRDGITDVKDELQEMSEKQINTLHGSAVLLKSAWDGLMLSFSDSTGAMKSTVDWLTKIINKLTEAKVLAGDLGSASSFFQKGADTNKAEEILKSYLSRGYTTEQLTGVIESDIKRLQRKLTMLEKEFEKYDKNLSVGAYTSQSGGLSSFFKKSKVTDIAEVKDQIATLELVLKLNEPAEVTETNTNGNGNNGDGGNDGTTGKTIAQQAQEKVDSALHRYQTDMIKITEEFKQGILEGPAALRKMISAKERVYTAYADAFDMTEDSQYKDGMQEWIESVGYSSAMLDELNTALADMRSAAQEAARELQNRKAIDNRTLNSLMGIARKSNIRYDEVGLTGIKQQINAADYFDIPDEQWQAIEDKFNEKLAELHLDPIKIDFETGTIQQVATEMADIVDKFQLTSQAIGSMGSALAGLEGSAAKIIGLVAQAVASVVAGLGSAIAQKGKDIDPWSWIAFTAAATATMISTVAAIKSVTAEYHAGGGFVGSGSRFSTMMRPIGSDTLPSMLSPGELVLNKSQQSNLASSLKAAPALADLHLETTIEAERIRIMLNNNNRRRGRGIAIQ